ncbi:MAG: NrfD/PsrC family molybdoenzyme membrane anchor subunit [Anaerolineae bacterium]
MFGKRISAAFVIWVGALLSVIAVGACGAYFVFTRGLIVTGLSDAVPWGLWITVDLSSIALSAGAFSVSAAIYILKMEKYKPIGRLAVFIGLIGYSMAVMTLLFDIGRPERFWHILAFGQPHSVLWEVTWCITLYLVVLITEVAPIVGETRIVQRLPLIPKLTYKLHQATPILAVVGLILSLLHQSSLGATYGVVKARPIWFKPNMAVLFIGSAIAGGLSLTILASLATSRIARREVVKKELLFDLAKVTAVVLIAYLYLKLWDTVGMSYTYLPMRSESLALLTRGPYSWAFWGWEIILGGVVPAVILAVPRLRENIWGLFTACALVVIGVVINRWNVNISGLVTPLVLSPSLSLSPLAQYTPTWVEWVTSAGVVAYGLLAYTLGTRFLPIFVQSE